MDEIRSHGFRVLMTKKEGSDFEGEARLTAKSNAARSL